MKKSCCTGAFMKHIALKLVILAITNLFALKCGTEQKKLNIMFKCIDTNP